MIASLPMYWRPETAEGWRAFWAEVQAQMPEVPDLTPPELLPEDLYAHWLDPGLVLSMTCGLPLRSALRDKVTYIGTLDFGLSAPAGHYFSQVITSIDPNAPSRLAYNSADSQSGWAAAQDLSPTTGYLETGSHAASLAAVADGRASKACIDAVTWRLLERSDPNAAKVRVSGQTQPRPGLPLITRKGADPTALRGALAKAVFRYRPKDPMEIGGPLSFSVLSESVYFQLPLPTSPPMR